MFAEKLAVRAKLDATCTSIERILVALAPRMGSTAPMQRDELEAIVNFINTTGDLCREVEKLLAAIDWEASGER